MANVFVFGNNSNSTLAGPITAGATALTLAAGTGAKFPNPGASQQFALTLYDAATQLINEIMYCTARTGDVLTVLRAQEGTTALAWLAGDLAGALITAGIMGGLVQQVAVSPTRIVTTSGAFVMTTADANGTVGLNRTAGVGTSNTALPSGAVAGQSYTIQDLASNFNGFPVTVNAPAGMTIAGLSAVTLNVNRGAWTFTYYGTNIWGLDT